MLLYTLSTTMLKFRCMIATNMHVLQRALPYCILALLFCLNVIVLWPGQMSPDSYSQYDAAVTGMYGDHHPPMMSVVWRLFDWCYKGSGLLFAFHLLFLYTAAAVCLKSFANYRWRWLYIVLPLVPPISFYSSMLWKDVGFAFSYLLALALISMYCMRNERPHWSVIVSIAALVFYGTAVKFQAQYVAPIALFGLSYVLSDFRVTKKTFGMTVLMTILCLGGVSIFNYCLVTPQGKGHTWQLVKLYDLAGITFYSGDNVFPDFINHYQKFSLRGIRQHFNHERVDDLTSFSDSPLRMGKHEQERQELLACWYKAVKKHPYYYFKHRFGNWLNIVNSVPIKKLDTLNFSHYKGLGWFCTLQHNARMSWHDAHGMYQCSIIALSTLFMRLLSVIRGVLCISVLLPFLMFYFLLGCIGMRSSNAAMPLIIMNGVSIALLLVLFFFCMASTIRYAYIVICLVHASHGFAYVCCKDWWKSRYS